MDSDLSLDFLSVVERAAIACAHTMGQGDGHAADQAAVEAIAGASSRSPSAITMGAVDGAPPASASSTPSIQGERALVRF
jgi:fructose-1,6-bisphosphatase/sedoheptulose 1,7-bisphosphatase-like protein